ncbi:NAD(P)/FAD-dependent oxidoreductase [Dongia sedimenti]|uniref:FAD-dependent oxidoreductase n=1 Tax=Dongia sedimenti TaxID=3064282 RepID=A0ABU0YVL6_9PROT|nr:FAD-dependent oxidoreductase [Rhodospirillaceae bacterium R-7]
MSDPIVIVGAGQAGVALAAKLRALGHAGRLILIGDEKVPPYQRPPLSKKYVSGELDVERLLIRPRDWYAEQNVELRLEERVVALWPREHELTLSDGARLRYRRLALTSGARPRTLPAEIGGALPGVVTIRGLADADAIIPQLKPGMRLVVVGGGYIGLEAAAVTAAKGMQVTVIEAAERILQRVAAAETSAYFRELHRCHGVTIREAAGLERTEGVDGRVASVLLKDGTVLPADLVIVGIGVLPNDDLARAAGLAVENGISVDESGRTSDPDIFAAGDCASFPWQGVRTRLESVQNAIEQAEHAAAAMLGAAAPYNPVPWFWSDQYDVKLQIAGLNRGYDQVVVRPGKRPGSQSVWYYRQGVLIAVDAMNDALAYAFGKKALEGGKTIAPAIAADPTADLKAALG